MDQPDLNPYAPPKADPNVRGPVVAPVLPPPVSPAELREALARLKQHVANPSAVEADLRAAGPRVRPVTWVFLGLFVAALAAFGWAFNQEDGRTAGIISGIAGFLFALIGLLLFVFDLSFVPRGTADAPEKALRRFFKALAMGRHGYAWASLSPTAREQNVEAPFLGPIAVDAGVFSMASPEGVKSFAKAFARQNQKTLRSLRVKSARSFVAPSNPDVAVVTAELMFQSWPIWVNILIAVGAGVFRPLIIVGAIALFVMRKKHSVTVTKTLLQGQAGVWYVLDARLFESPPVL